MGCTFLGCAIDGQAQQATVMSKGQTWRTHVDRRLIVATGSDVADD
jgi:hypothetical protein